MRNVLDKSCRENENTHFTHNNFFRKACRLWDNVERYREARGTVNEVTIWRIPAADWISKATYTHGHAHGHAPWRARAHTHKYVVFIAFPRQLWLRERASMSRYTYIACLVVIQNPKQIHTCKDVQLTICCYWSACFGHFLWPSPVCSITKM
jgi:hypothetical protein